MEKKNGGGGAAGRDGKAWPRGARDHRDGGGKSL